MNEKNIPWKHPHLAQLNVLGAFNSIIFVLETQFLYLWFCEERWRVEGV
jgi:hypothetical protein